MTKSKAPSNLPPAGDPHQIVIGPNTWVRVCYKLFSFQDEMLEENFRELTYLHGGYGEVLPKIEEALTAKTQGFRQSLFLEPEDAFGEYDADLLNMIQRDELAPDIEVGMSIEGMPGNEDEGVIYTVTDLTDTVAVVDGNHPLAGMGVRFDIEVLEVRLATQDEIDEQQLKGGWVSPETAPGSDSIH